MRAKRELYPWIISLLFILIIATTTVYTSDGHGVQAAMGLQQEGTPTPTATTTGTATPTPTPTVTPSGPFGGNPPLPLACGAEVHRDTQSAPSRVLTYSCRPTWLESGPEHLYRLNLSPTQPLTLTLSETSADLDVFLLSDMDPDTCIAAGDTYIQRDTLPAGLYYVVVDGYNGAAGEYTLRVSCPTGKRATSTPTPTNTPTPVYTYTPTPFPTETPTPTATPLGFRHWEAYLPTLLKVVPGPTPPPVTVILQDGVNGYSGTRDTYISKWVMDKNYGQAQWLSLRSPGIMSGLIYFDMQPFPEDTKILSATLSINIIYRSNSNPMTITLYQLLRPWREREATWRKAMNSAFWGVLGANDPMMDHFYVPAATATLTSDEDWVHIDITKAFYAWQRDPDNNFGLLLQATNGGQVEYRLASREHLSLPRHPWLTVRYLPYISP